MTNSPRFAALTMYQADFSWVLWRLGSGPHRLPNSHDVFFSSVFTKGLGTSRWNWYEGLVGLAPLKGDLQLESLPIGRILQFSFSIFHFITTMDQPYDPVAI